MHFFNLKSFINHFIQFHLFSYVSISYSNSSLILSTKQRSRPIIFFTILKHPFELPDLYLKGKLFYWNLKKYLLKIMQKRFFFFLYCRRIKCDECSSFTCSCSTRPHCGNSICCRMHRFGNNLSKALAQVCQFCFHLIELWIFNDHS